LPPTRRIGWRCGSSVSRRPDSHRIRSTEVVRGEVFRLPAPRAPRGREQRGARYAVIVQADEFMGLSTTLVSPTSTSARPATFRPTISLEGNDTRVLVEQTVVVDPQRLGDSAGRLDADELRAVDDALALVLGL
jgi:mRNA interferase MazF